MKYIIALVIGCVLIISCSGNTKFNRVIKRYKPALAQIQTWINKQGFLYASGETTPIVFNGLLYYINVGNQSIQVLDSSGAVISQYYAPVEYISAFVNNGTVHVFSTEYGSHNRISMYSSNDLFTWSAHGVVIPDSGEKFFNTSVTVGDGGRFTMAVEYLHEDLFSPRFYESTDLLNWTPVGGRMFDEYYTAGMTIRYFAPYYYVFYISETDPAKGPHEWNTNVARSIDLSTWEDSKIQVLAASQEPDGNASDIDFVELGGEVKIVYLNTSQDMRTPTPGVGLIKATYSGTLKQFCEEFF